MLRVRYTLHALNSSGVWHILAKAKTGIVHRAVSILLAALIGDGLGFGRCNRLGQNPEPGQQITLYQRVDVQTLLGLLAELLAFEPVELLFEVVVINTKRRQPGRQLCVLVLKFSDANGRCLFISISMPSSKASSAVRVNIVLPFSDGDNANCPCSRRFDHIQ